MRGGGHHRWSWLQIPDPDFHLNHTEALPTAHTHIDLLLPATSVHRHPLPSQLHKAARGGHPGWPRLRRHMFALKACTARATGLRVDD